MKCGLVHESKFDNIDSPWHAVRGHNSKARRIGEYYLFIEAAEDEDAISFTPIIINDKELGIIDETATKAWLDDCMANK